jgi:hypothetical protein
MYFILASALRYDATQGRSVHGSRVSRLSPANTMETKNKKSSVLRLWFSGTPYTGTQQNRSPGKDEFYMIVFIVFHCMEYH